MGKSRIRVNALSPGPILTRAGQGLADFDELLREAQRRSPLHETPLIADVRRDGGLSVSDGARHVTGNIAFIDGGTHVMG